MSAVEVVTDDVAEQVFRGRLSGISERALSRHFGLSLKQVHQVIDRLAPTVDATVRRRELSVELARIDDLLRVFHQRALAGDVPSASICLRLSERRGSLLGFETAPLRDLTVISVEPTARPSSTAMIKDAIMRVVNERPAVTQSAPVLNGEVLPPDGAVPH